MAHWTQQVILFLWLLCSVEAQCPSGYTLNGNICYDFRNSNLMNWSPCYSYCIDQNALVVCIQNLAQHNYVYTTRGSTRVWLGATKVSGTLTWLPGCTSTYSNLAAGEGSGAGEDNYLMFPQFGSQWIDAVSTSNCACVCQVDAQYPTSQPSSQPSRQPSPQPSQQPSSHPSAQPSSQPSTQPTVNFQHRLSILSSPTFQPRNGFAFAALTSTGRVETWGEAQYGGNSTAVRSTLSSGVATVVHSRFAFVALKGSGAVVPWGNAVDLLGSVSYASLPSIKSVVSNRAAFALVESSTGAVRTFGSPHHGGDIADSARCLGCSTALASGVSNVVATADAFVAVKSDGTAFAWGSKFSGGIAPGPVLATLQSITMVTATTGAFAALLRSGRVVAWGEPYMGGDSSGVESQLREVWHLSSSKTSFVAYKKDGSAVVWGHPVFADTGTVQAQLSAGVVYVAHTFVASAALKADGSVVTWGRADGGGDSSAVQAQLHDIVKVYGNGKAFAALTSTGGVVAWGKASDGGQIPAGMVSALSSGVVSIHHTDRAFVALKSDGSVVAWGQAGHGGSPGASVEALLISGVHTVCANDAAFSAIKADGSVVAWGHSVSVPAPGVQFTSAGMTTPVRC